MKRQQAIESWLRKKQISVAAGNGFLGIGVFVLAAFVLFVTFWVIYVVVYLALGWVLPHSHEVRLLLSGVGLVLLFIGNATTGRLDMKDCSVTTGTGSDRPVTIVIPFVGIGSTINPLAADTMRSFARFLCDILFVGPRLTIEAMRLVGGSGQLADLDVQGCSAVLAYLAARDGPVPFAELASAIPAGHNVVAVLTGIQKIDGVRLVMREPAGLSLFSELRQELPKGKRKAGKHRENGPKPDASEEKEQIE
jgi:hypothetical protein